MSIRRVRALSLAEVLIAVALLGILLLVQVRILIPGLRLWKQTRALSELEQQAMVVEAKLESALLGTVSDTITVLDTQDLQAMSFLNTEGSLTQSGYVETTGEVWCRSMTVFIYRPGSKRLSQLSWAENSGPHACPTTDLFAFTQAELQGICSSSEFKPKIVSDKVKSFKIVQGSNKGTWEVTLELEAQMPNGPHVIQRGFTVKPRIQKEVKS